MVFLNNLSTRCFWGVSNTQPAIALVKNLPNHDAGRTSCSLYGRNTFQTLDFSFRYAAIYKNIKDCPVTLEYINITYTVQEFIPPVLLYYRIASLYILTPVN